MTGPVRTAVVSGGGAGIGLAVADRFVDEGLRVFVLDRAPTSSERWTSLACDVTSAEDVAAAAARVEQEAGSLDVLVNGVGAYLGGTVEETTDADWSRLLEINVVSMARVSRAFLPLLRRGQSPSIVNLCSVVGTTGVPGRTLYSTTKGAVLSLTRAMAADHRADGIRVNGVVPGAVDTAQVTGALADSDDPAGERAAMDAGQPLGRLITPAEVADAIAYFAGTASLSTTGTFLVVDQGVTSLLG